MNKEEINIVTITLETYMDLIQRATVNEMLLKNIEDCNRRIWEIENRMYQLEGGSTRR